MNGLMTFIKFFEGTLHVFAKILKLPFETSKKCESMWVLLMNYFQEKNVVEMLKKQKKLLASLSPIIHSTKSILEIPESFEFLGSFIDSRAITVKINPEQSIAIIKEIETFISKSKNHY